MYAWYRKHMTYYDISTTSYQQDIIYRDDINWISYFIIMTVHFWRSILIKKVHNFLVLYSLTESIATFGDVCIILSPKTTKSHFYYTSFIRTFFDLHIQRISNILQNPNIFRPNERGRLLLWLNSGSVRQQNWTASSSLCLSLFTDEITSSFVGIVFQLIFTNRTLKLRYDISMHFLL